VKKANGTNDNMNIAKSYTSLPKINTTYINRQEAGIAGSE
jgi:hypothetical protein